MSTRERPDGSTYVADNGYHYTKQDGKWRLTHHILAESVLGRPLQPNERVYFKDKDRTHLSRSNVEVRTVKSPEQKLREMKARRALLDEDIRTLEAKIAR